MNATPAGRRYVVKVSSAPAWWDWMRQFPNRSGVWGDCEFKVNADVPECDFWFVVGDLPAAEQARCDPARVAFVLQEPPEVLPSLPPAFACQFTTIYACSDHRLPGPAYRPSEPALPWHVGRARAEGGVWKWSYDDLRRLSPPAKTRDISVVCSSKSFTKGHADRLRAVACLKRYFGDRLDVFGNGIREVEDKWDALASYRYHLSIENSVHDHYFTEKLTDAYLAWCLPFYHGCPDVGDYFPDQSLVRIDIGNMDQTIAAIERALSEDAAASRLEAVGEARRRCLDNYQLFPLLARFATVLGSPGIKREVSLKPLRDFQGRGWAARAIGRGRRLVGTPRREEPPDPAREALDYLRESK